MLHNSETHVIAEIVRDCRGHDRHRQNSGIDEEKKQRILGRTNTSRDNANDNVVVVAIEIFIIMITNCCSSFSDKSLKLFSG